jgi:hypothetical protein
MNCQSFLLTDPPLPKFISIVANFPIVYAFNVLENQSLHSPPKFFFFNQDSIFALSMLLMSLQNQSLPNPPPPSHLVFLSCLHFRIVYAFKCLWKLSALIPQALREIPFFTVGSETSLSPYIKGLAEAVIIE